MSQIPHGDDIPTVATSAGFQSGQRVGAGRYVLKKLLGRGGMGIVWLAHDETLADDVALKFLSSVDPIGLQALRKETRRTRRLTHPNIIRIHDLFESENEAAFISMEYVDGSTLSAIAGRHPNGIVPWEYLSKLLAQLCDALDYAHGENVIHRDLKPANVMLDTSDRTHERVKLADFGIARILSDSVSRHTNTNETSGTRPYMSPQQLDGKPSNPCDDVYSLGATLYELLTGTPPFYTGEIAHQIRYVPAEPISARLKALNVKNLVPFQVEATIAACLSKDPSRRPQSAGEIAEKLGLKDKARGLFTFRRRRELAVRQRRFQIRFQIGFTIGVVSIAAAGMVFYWTSPKFKQYASSGSNSVPQDTNYASPSIPLETNPPPVSIVATTTVPTGTPSVLTQLPPAVAQSPPTSTNPITPPPTSTVVAATSVVVAPPPANIRGPKTNSPVRALVLYPRLGSPWTNGLGMILLPVPGTEVLFSKWETRVQDYRQWTNRNAVGLLTGASSDGLPITEVSWKDAASFCDWLTQTQRVAQKLKMNQYYRLPTDVEWSLAAGLPAEAGATPAERHRNRFSISGSVYPWQMIGQSVAPKTGNYDLNVSDNYNDVAPVGKFPANPNRLLDLSGNVREWCEDWWDNSKKERTIRGGSWITREYDELHLAFRQSSGPGYEDGYTGFRCVLVVGSKTSTGQ